MAARSRRLAVLASGCRYRAIRYSELRLPGGPNVSFAVGALVRTRGPEWVVLL
jgi:hypothetical protein